MKRKKIQKWYSTFNHLDEWKFGSLKDSNGFFCIPSKLPSINPIHTKIMCMLHIMNSNPSCGGFRLGNYECKRIGPRI